MFKKKIISITIGEIYGIGPYISIFSSWNIRKYSNIILLGNIFILNNICNKFNSNIKLLFISQYKFKKKKIIFNNFYINVINFNNFVYNSNIKTFKKNSFLIIEILNFSIYSILNRKINAVINSPIQKSYINKINFLGHTNYLTNLINIKYSLMTFCNKKNNFFISLLTTHLAFSKIIKHITKKNIINSINIIYNEFIKKFKINNFKIIIVSLNPHSGENGILGFEEIKILIPSIKYFENNKIINIIGPIAADSIFRYKNIKNKCFLFMYHDQGLVFYKYINPNSTNITLGLPFIRTSVDHGTGIDLMKSKNIKKIDLKSMKNTIIITNKLINL